MRLALIATGMALAASTAHGQLIVGHNRPGIATMYHIDVDTGAATEIYAALTNDAKPWGMAFDPVTDTLYWNNGSTLYSSPLSMSLTPTVVGTLTLDGLATSFIGLGFRDGVLLGTPFTTSSVTEAVYQIDPVTGVSTSAYVYDSGFDFGGLDVDSVNGRVYGLTDSATGGRPLGLYELNIERQTTTFVAPHPASESDLDGLAVHAGLAYYVSDGPNSLQPNFYVYDIASGELVRTIPSPFANAAGFAGATFVPTPGGLGLLALAAIGSSRRRR